MGCRINPVLLQYIETVRQYIKKQFGMDEKIWFP